METRTPLPPSRGRLAGVALPAVFIVLAAGAVAAAVLTGDDGHRREAELPTGTVLVAALTSTISTEVSEVGDPVRLETTEPVTVDGDTVLPAGSVLLGEVTHAEGGGRIGGAPALTLRFTAVEVDGERYRVETQPFRVRGKDDALESAAQIGGGAVAGGVVGGVLGGGGGALKGALAGAAIGTGVALATDGDDLTLPTGLKLKVTLAAPLTVTYLSSSG